jgi:hypothetical protein
VVASPFTAWHDGRETRTPLRIRHEVGDGEGLRLLIDSPDTQESYYLDERGELGVRFGARRPGELDQWLRTVQPGHEYVIRYARARDCGARRWRWERTVVMYAIASRGIGVMAHACGFVTAGGLGVLAPGASGVGKSTLAAQIAESLGRDAILSDDRVALTRELGRPWIWGTPWHSSAGYLASTDAVLGAVVLPARSDGGVPRVRDLSAREALPRILRAIAAPFWSEPAMESMLDTLDRALSAARVLEYAYTPGPGAAEPLLRALT